MNEAKGELVLHQESAPAPGAVTPMQLLQIATQQGADVEKLSQLMALQERFEANEARKAYVVAFAAFKAEGVKIVKNITISAGPLNGKKYADLHAAVSAITPAMSQFGLTASWSITKDEKDWIEVECSVRHVSGHCESIRMGGPPDQGGAKNSIQARASTLSYLERYTLLAITGLSTQNQDDDGAGGKGPANMPETAKADWHTAIDALASTEEAEALWPRLVASCTTFGDVPAYDELKSAFAKKRKALQGAKA